MLYSAVVDSPLGQILLQADLGGLVGLYFSDQQDCPGHTGLHENNGLYKPSDGLLNNLPLRKFKVQSDSGDEIKSQVGLFGSDKAQIKISDGFLINVSSINFNNYQLLDDNVPEQIDLIFKQTAKELNLYWHQQLTEFTIPLNPQGTDFRKKVWQALLKVPFGSSLSYGELGNLAGFETKHGRAIGGAVGSNPISIIIPCHRILAANNTLNGYGGGLSRKAYLLQLEGFHLISCA